jgi:hypothetical protein
MYRLARDPNIIRMANWRTQFEQLEPGSFFLDTKFLIVGRSANSIVLPSATLAFGSTVPAVAYATGHIPHSHLNPAVLIELWPGGPSMAGNLHLCCDTGAW